MRQEREGIVNVQNWVALVNPERVVRTSDPTDKKYARFVCEPLERGYALTLGNALRRVLLSSLQGYAPVFVKISGVQHEFSSIPGVVEDVTDIILNIKQLRFALTTSEPQTIYIKSSKKGLILGKDLECSANVKILTPEQPILTLSEDRDLYCEIEVRMGKGYVPADMHENIVDSIGIIRLDATFSPVLKVAYVTEQARVGQKTDYDRLILEVWTDGSVDPVDAISYAAKILKEQLTVFVNFDEQALDDVANTTNITTDVDPIFFKRIDELELSVRASNCLKSANITYLGELVQKTENDMLRTKNFGRKSLDEIKTLINSMGLSFGSHIENFEQKLQERRMRGEDEA